ncbi:MAG: rhomboid family intramembrane serine protease [Deltaproteobacteria bacterium]|nr:rhomboid family intramembrane serine protease [Deltaproteobacteria bacterium]MBW2218033.1 rhomboid family intramembrane serine protease [Deltaproteobacteria bacterium]
MIVVPITGKISLKNPPVITICMILINCIVLFGFQAGDTRKYYESGKYYFDSGLADIEVPKYISHIGPDAEKKALAKFKGDEDEERLVYFYREMEADQAFLEMLYKGIVVSKDDPEYETWKGLRAEYERMRSQIISLKYGFRPTYHRPVTFFTYMFLHGGFGHIFGNMIFLWLVGCILEMGCGRIVYAIIYLATGLGAVTLFWVVYPTSNIPLIGASGAIAGLMGAFTVLFGKSRVKFFLYLGFYFNYLKIPAIVILPIWIGNEFFQLLFGGVRQVAYVAHIGGLVSGATAGFIIKRYFGFQDDEVFREEPEDEVSPLIEAALHHIGKLELDKGRALLEQALDKDPENCEALMHIFNIEKQDPESPGLHDSAKRLLNSLSMDTNMHDKVFGVYQEYTTLLKPKFTPVQYVRLSSIFAVQGHIETAEKIITMLVKKKPDLPGLPTALLRLIDACKKISAEEKLIKYRKLLVSKYPDSLEGRVAAKRFD